LITSAVLAALQEWKRRKERLWVAGRGMLDRMESELGKAWQEWFENGGKLSLSLLLSETPLEADSISQPDPRDSLPAWLAAQTISSITTPVLARDFPSTVSSFDYRSVIRAPRRTLIQLTVTVSPIVSYRRILCRIRRRQSLRFSFTRCRPRTNRSRPRLA